MRFVALILLALVGSASSAETNDPEVAVLLEQLGAESFAERKTAEKGLRDKLPGARIQIAAYLDTAEDPEVRERIKRMPLRIKVMILGARRYSESGFAQLVGGAAIWSKGKQIDLHAHRVWSSAQLLDSFKGHSGKGYDHVIVVLRGTGLAPTEFVRSERGRSKLAFVTRTDFVEGFPTVRGNEPAGYRLLAKALHTEYPEGANIAVLKGTVEDKQGGRRLTLLRTALGKSPINIASSPNYESQWNALQAVRTALKKNPKLDAAIDLDTFSPWPLGGITTDNESFKTFSLRTGDSGLYELDKGIVGAAIEAPWDLMGQAAMQSCIEGIPENWHVTIDPILRKKGEGIERARKLRKVVLEGRVAIQNAEKSTSP